MVEKIKTNGTNECNEWNQWNVIPGINPCVCSELIFSKSSNSQALALTPVILASQEAEMRRIMV
jgi:hypothetical protein